jgi:uncharacterized linocin/CFP29 family protein
MTVATAVKTGTKYTHLELGQDVDIGIAGYYTPEREVRLPYSDREILYVVGRAVVETSCCGIKGNWTYAIVPGYVINWQYTHNERGLPVSEVQPIPDEATRERIRQLIEKKESAVMVGFW